MVVAGLTLFSVFLYDFNYAKVQNVMGGMIEKAASLLLTTMGGGIATIGLASAFLLRKQFDQDNAMKYVLSANKANNVNVKKLARLIDDLLCDLPNN